MLRHSTRYWGEIRLHAPSPANDDVLAAIKVLLVAQILQHGPEGQVRVTNIVILTAA